VRSAEFGRRNFGGEIPWCEPLFFEKSGSAREQGVKAGMFEPGNETGRIAELDETNGVKAGENRSRLFKADQACSRRVKVVFKTKTGKAARENGHGFEPHCTNPDLVGVSGALTSRRYRRG